MGHHFLADNLIGSFDDYSYGYMGRMMGEGYGGGWFVGLHAFLGLITWIAFIVLLIAAARWFWIGGGKK